MPKSHHIISELGFDKDDENDLKHTFDDLHKKIKYNMERVFF